MNNLRFSINLKNLQKVVSFLQNREIYIYLIVLSVVSIVTFIIYYTNGLGLSYNDARSHLDIGRRVVEGLKPGLAQLGSVWLPLPHILMIPTVWNDFMWHTGLSGALVSMISFVITGLLIYKFLKELGVGAIGRLIGVLIFVANLNILYLQSTAMTEMLLLVTMTATVYELLLWFKKENILNLLKSAFFAMLSTMVRYDGWFLVMFCIALISIEVYRKKGYKITEGVVILFATLAGFGIFLWFLWNQLIFKDALYFMFGPFSAHTQQEQLEIAGNLATKGNLLFSIKVYLFAIAYNSNTFIALLGLIGALILWMDKRIKVSLKIATTALMAPLFFNILSLYLGQSVLFIQGLSGNTWFNVRYGITLMPSIAIFIGFLVDRLKTLRIVTIGLLLFVIFFSFTSLDATTIDDAKVGSSQKNVSEVSGWLNKNAKDKPGFVLISAASHDAIIFSSGLPMSKFIHEGTGAYWEEATTNPGHWARWIIMRTYDNQDMTYRAVSKTPDLIKYNMVGKYPFADIYELKDDYLPSLITTPILGKQK
ncbi:MAG: hypothetical protein PHQ59_03475 [Candidatus Daviesbacteria bacterium]|nr:hypothetical protein [Candidatus Daviesbacteria bacterium]